MARRSLLTPEGGRGWDRVEWGRVGFSKNADGFWNTFEQHWLEHRPWLATRGLLCAATQARHRLGDAGGGGTQLPARPGLQPRSGVARRAPDASCGCMPWPLTSAQLDPLDGEGAAVGGVSLGELGGPQGACRAAGGCMRMLHLVDLFKCWQASHRAASAAPHLLHTTARLMLLVLLLAPPCPPAPSTPRSRRPQRQARFLLRAAHPQTCHPAWWPQTCRSPRWCRHRSGSCRG